MSSGMFGLPKGNLGSDINCIVSKSSSVFTNAASGTEVAIPNFLIDFPASGEYPVIIEFVPDGSSAQAAVIEAVTGPQLIAGLSLFRDGIDIGRPYVRSNVSVDPSIRVATPSSSFRFVDFPSKGTHQYLVKLRNDSNGTCSIEATKMIVREDRSIRYKQL